MAEIRETVTVDTDQAVTNLGELKGASKEADTAVDDLKESADKADSAEIKIPVDLTGAKEAATDLGEVDKKARAAGEGAKVGVSDISDLTGPLGDASGAASTMGQSMEGAGNLAKTAAEKMGASPEQIGKLESAMGLASVAIGLAAVAWTTYKDEQERARVGAEEVRDALGQVYEKLREGDAMAAAQTFVDTMSEKIEKFRELVGGGITKADIAGVMFGDPESIARVDEAVGKLDGSTRFMAENGVKILRTRWDEAKKAADENIALETKIAGYFGNLDVKATEAADGVDEVTDAYYRNVDAANAVTAADPFVSNLQFANGDIGPSSSTLTTVNIYPPANTPIAVDAATRRNAQIQGPR